MNVYDFDDTIYDGESLFDFFLFCLKKHIILIRYAPFALIYLVKYKSNKLKISQLHKILDKTIQQFVGEDVEKYSLYSSEFWEKNQHKLKPEFLNLLKPKDIIITGCPDFLLNPILDQLNTSNIISSKFNLETKKITFICLGEYKVKALKEYAPNVQIHKLYTDSHMDEPLMKLSKEVYLVKKNKITQIK